MKIERSFSPLMVVWIVGILAGLFVLALKVLVLNASAAEGTITVVNPNFLTDLDGWTQIGAASWRTLGNDDAGSVLVSGADWITQSLSLPASGIGITVTFAFSVTDDDAYVWMCGSFHSVTGVGSGWHDGEHYCNTSIDWGGDFQVGFQAYGSDVQIDNVVVTYDYNLPTATSTRTTAPTYTPANTRTPAPTYTPRATSTTGPTWTPRATSTRGPTWTPGSTSTRYPTSTARSTSTRYPTSTLATATRYPTSTHGPTSTRYPTSTLATSTRYPTSTRGPTATRYPTSVPGTAVPTYTPFPTSTRGPTWTPRATSTQAPTWTPRPTNTLYPTATQ